MNLNKTIKSLITLALPYIKKLIETKLVPYVKLRIYKCLDNFSTKAIKSLEKLLTKIKETQDPIKKEEHLKGFNIGLEIIEKVGQKLTESAIQLQKGVEE